jgi:acyl-CoA thioester hydrolase
MVKDATDTAGLDRPYAGGFDGGVHRFALRVYFEDTDLTGIVYHANYLRYMERARSDMLRAAGIDQRAAHEAGEGAYAVADLAIRYRRPARLEDALVVHSRVTEVRAASCAIHQRVIRGDEVLAEADVTAAFLSPDGRPRRQPRAWVEAFERLRGVS